MSGYLETLTITPPTGERGPDAVVRRRNRLLGHLRQQMELWDHARRGVVWQGKKVVFDSDPATGRRAPRTVYRRPRRWFDPEPAGGGYRVRCYYRHTAIVLRPPDGTDVRCDRFDQVGDVIATLVEAARLGELDDALRTAAEASRGPR